MNVAVGCYSPKLRSAFLNQNIFGVKMVRSRNMVKTSCSYYTTAARESKWWVSRYWKESQWRCLEHSLHTVCLRSEKGIALGTMMTVFEVVQNGDYRSLDKSAPNSWANYLDQIIVCQTHLVYRRHPGRCIRRRPQCMCFAVIFWWAHKHSVCEPLPFPLLTHESGSRYLLNE